MPAYTSARYAYEGTETTETSVTRVGGASDPAGQQQSRKIVTTANAQWLRPFKAEPYAVWNGTTGANVTVTVCGITPSTALPNTDDLWLELSYLGSASDTLGTIAHTTKANVLASGAAVASDSSTWSGASAGTVTWDSSTIASVTLSGGDLVVTSGGTTATNQGARVATAYGKVGGKFYFEVTLTTLSAGADVGICVSDPTSSYTNLGVGTASGIMMFPNSGNIWTAGANTGISLGARATGQVIGVAIDTENRQGWYRVAPSGNWNNSGTANPATNTGGIAVVATVPLVPFAVFGGSGGAAISVFTANFGASSFTGSVPSGFTSGFPTWSAFKLTKTLSSPQPGQAGYIHARIRAGKASATYYIDPLIVLT